MTKDELLAKLYNNYSMNTHQAEVDFQHRAAMLARAYWHMGKVGSKQSREEQLATQDLYYAQEAQFYSNSIDYCNLQDSVVRELFTEWAEPIQHFFPQEFASFQSKKVKPIEAFDAIIDRMVVSSENDF